MEPTKMALLGMPDTPFTAIAKLATQKMPSATNMVLVSESRRYNRTIDGDHASTARCIGMIDNVRIRATIVPKVAPSDVNSVSIALNSDNAFSEAGK